MRLLVIEDNPGDADLVAAYLEPIEVLMADTLAAGLDLAGGVDAVLLDLHLPDSFGLDSLRSFREHHPRKPVIVLAGQRGQDIGLDAMRLGAHDFVDKNQLSEELLRATVESALERARTRNRLRKAEARWRALLDADTSLVFELDLDGTVVFQNRAATTICGRDMEGESWLNLAPQLERGRLLAARQRLEMDPQVVQLDVVLTPNGDRRWHRVGLCPLHDDGELHRVVMTATDIDEEIRENEQLARILETMPNGMFLVEEFGRIVLANAAAHRIFDFDGDTLVGRTLSELLPDHHTRLMDWVALGTTPTPNDPVELTGRLQSGELVTLLVGVQRITLSEGPLTLLAVTDLSAQRELEDQLRQSQKMEAVGALAGGIAHDFNNLLMVILSFAQFAGDSLDKDSDAYADLKEVIDAAERASSLTRQLLTFSRKQPTEPSVLDLAELVSGTERLLRRVIGEDIELDTRLTPNAGLILIDPSMAEQVLINLAVNARDAMPHGGTLAVVVRPGPNDTVELRVQDTGRGMSESVAARIFEPFFTTKPVGQGTGLGLSTCYGIVEQAGGTISVDSIEGVGTTFKLRFPRSEESLDDVSVAAGANAPLSGRILVVEDEEQVRRSVERILRRAGCEVSTAEGPAAALDFFAEGKRVDLIVTDVVMPGGNGQELVRRIREQTGELPAIFMSGYAPETIDSKGIHLSHFLHKPFEPHDLIEAVRAALPAGGTQESA